MIPDNLAPDEKIKNTSKGDYVIIKDSININFFFLLSTDLKRNCMKQYVYNHTVGYTMDRNVWE